jgi:hypothetical protein
MKNYCLKRVVSIFVLSQICFFAVAAGSERTNRLDPKITANKYFVQSNQLMEYARKAYAQGDFDTSQRYAVEAVKAARLSDQYTGIVLKITETEQKLVLAYNRLILADKSNAAKNFPKQFLDAKEFYNEALAAQSSRKWDEAIYNADKVVATLASLTTAPNTTTAASKTPAAKPAAPAKPSVPAKPAIQVPAPQPASQPPLPAVTVPTVPEQKTIIQPVSLQNQVTQTKNENSEINKDIPLPAKYVVRPWDTFGDCFWNIAARSWVYGDGHFWTVLYRANKANLPDPNNPDWIEPGMVLNIPSIHGEKREGMWDSGVPYKPLHDVVSR